jgi:hypothetical protein
MKITIYGWSTNPANRGGSQDHPGHQQQPLRYRPLTHLTPPTPADRASLEDVPHAEPGECMWSEHWL